MRISETTTSFVPLSQQRLEKTGELQNVFSAVLGSVGREGYQSAEAISAEQPLDEQMRSSWDGWFGMVQTRRYQEIEKPAELAGAFGQLMHRAYREGGYVDPKSFLGGLSADEIENVRLVHHLADPINVSSLTEEGALNLLIPPDAQVDLNRDGITQSGVGNGVRFPDSTTPRPVAEAWHLATADLPEGEKMTYELQMVLPTLLANIHLNPDGSFSHQVEPGDVNWRNPMAAPEYSYRQFTQGMLQSLDYFKSQMDPLKYERDHAFWSDLQSRLPDENSSTDSTA